MANVYVPTVEVQRRLDPVNTSWSSTETQAMDRIIEAVSRLIDDYTGRRFYKTASTARYFTAEDGTWLAVDDLVSVTTLKHDEDGDRTYETTWASTDYDLMPHNAATDGKPYTEINVTPSGRYSFPTHAKGVEITGVWGWPKLPAPIVEACVLESMRTWQHAQSPSGVSSDTELGTWIVAPELHPRSMGLLAPYRIPYVGAA